MSRHLIGGRMGSGDTRHLPMARDEVLTELALGPPEGLRYGIGGVLDEMRRLGLNPSEVAVDLLVLAAHVHAADTRLFRGTEGEDSWTRIIRLVVPVSDVARWTRAAPIIVRALDFLTGDRWQVGFRARPRTHARLVRAPEPRLVPLPYDEVSLFSGGLDSLIGAIDELSAGRSPLLVSHYGEGSVSSPQEACYLGLRTAMPRLSFNRVRMWMVFEQGLVDGVTSETTTRGRSFLFFALGAAVGSGLRRPFMLRVPENGLIALNVPLDPLRLGAASTRTTHPFHLARWNEMLAEVGISGRLENPYRHKTKGEMVAGCADPQLLGTLAPQSMSCSSPTKNRFRGYSQGHCGHCLPCLIRRAALLDEDDTYYQFDVRDGSILNTRRAEGVQVRSFQYAIERLRRHPNLARILIHKPGSLADVEDELDALSGIYARGMEEVGRLLDGVRARPG